MDNRAGEMETFVKVIEHGSFSQAARDLHMSPSAVSKLVTRIEDRLGTRLLVRSTRQLQLTPEGEMYLRRARTILDQIDETDRLIGGGGQAAPRGKLSVNASVAFAQVFLIPNLPRFLRQYPDIELELTQTDGIVDLLEERADIAIRSGLLADSNLMARKLLETKRKIVASPDYLAEHGIPQTPADLARHKCLRFNFIKGRNFWPFTDPQSGRRFEQTISGDFLGNNGPLVKAMCIAGIGIARIGNFHVEDAIKRGDLVEILNDWTADDVETVHAVWAGHDHLATRIRAFIDFVASCVKEA
ncbi:MULTISPECIES: LysR family transcriptional regulator [Thalassospira]|uniref:LysR family transcriptional regulator n=2 Tax=Thalassospira TaxID=168934 RepID=A0A367W947_9PROT|nr:MULTISPECIES: LysR family transcriptional regulator [Thalassospira]MDG4719143.1 LysR family transcriptional regulator [Thalassospira sp. FZY0004]RCK37072.1 LysR family transcriptional regulator [Thalassospira profundimaris]